MIAFDCPHCKKPLIVPNNKAGGQYICPGCKASVTVPQPPRPSRLRGVVKPLLWLAFLAAVASPFAWNVYRNHEPERLAKRLVSDLQAQAPQWQGLSWVQCDPQVGDFRLSVFYTAPQKRYAFTASYFVPVDQVFVWVDQTADETNFLASMTLTAGEIESFRYTGGSDAERDELARLTESLARSISRAVR